MTNRSHMSAEQRAKVAAMLRRPTLIGRLFLWLLDQAALHTTEKCRAYGGIMPDGRVRLCGKGRWHWDSHVYEFVEGER